MLNPKLAAELRAVVACADVAQRVLTLLEPGQGPGSPAAAGRGTRRAEQLAKVGLQRGGLEHLRSERSAMAVKRETNVRTGTPTLFGRAVIYARFSLDKVGEAAGVGRQSDACGRLADLEGWSADEVPVDNDLSAYSGACRPEYERLLDLGRRREIHVIVTYHPDRLYRRLADLVELTKVVASAGVEIRTVAAGHVHLHIAEYLRGKPSAGRRQPSMSPLGLMRCSVSVVHLPRIVRDPDASES